MYNNFIIRGSLRDKKGAFSSQHADVCPGAPKKQWLRQEAVSTSNAGPFAGPRVASTAPTAGQGRGAAEPAGQ
jgi:hypothetical protein